MGFRQSIQNPVSQPKVCHFWNPFQAVELLEDYKERSLSQIVLFIEYFLCSTFFFHKNPLKSVGVNVPILQTRKLRLKEVKGTVQGHIDTKWMQESEILGISTCSIFILSYWFLAPYCFFFFLLFPILS